MQVYAPNSLTSFEPKYVAANAWMEHVCFCYDVVKAVRPSLLVELGTHRAVTYFSFCQSMKDQAIDGLCYAVDTWKCDKHTDGQNDSLYEEIENHNRRHYQNLSYLMRMPINAAVDHFSDGTIDFLHIDGARVEDTDIRDLNSWLDKVKAGGIVLLHGINERNGDTCIGKFWNEVSQEHHSFCFTHGLGLGVLRTSDAAEFQSSDPLLSQLFNRNSDAGEQLREFYAIAAQFQTMKHKFANSRFAQRKQRSAKTKVSA